MTNTTAAESFTDAAGFRAAWSEARGQILEAHGYPRDARNIRLASGLITMDVEIGGRWIPWGNTAQIDMLDRIRLGGTFRLRTAR